MSLSTTWQRRIDALACLAGLLWGAAPAQAAINALNLGVWDSMRLVLATDTASWNEGANTMLVPGSEAFIGGEGTSYNMEGRSLLLLIAM
jgi:hypothetical protein